MFGFRRRPRSADPGPAATAEAAPASDVRRVLARLEWTVVRRLDGQLQGDYRTLFRGEGMDLADLREYQLHDDVRHIDWNVTARMQAPYVREHQAEREMTTWLLVDVSGSVDFGSAARTKRALAVEFAGVIARILVRRGNPVGALLSAGDTRAVEAMVPARTGRRHVLHLMDRVARCAAPAAARTTDLRPLLLHAAAALRRRGTVFVISDFIAQAGWDAPLASLARRHDVVAVRLRDPLEGALPSGGLVVVQDAETGEQLWLDSGDSGIRERFAAHAEARESALRQTFARAGVDCLELDTNEPLDEAILGFVRLRRRRAMLSAGAAAPRAATGTA